MKVPTFFLEACSKIIENIRGKLIPLATPCNSRSHKSSVKLLATAAQIVPRRKLNTAARKRPTARNLFRKYEPKGTITVETSIYPVVNHWIVAGPRWNSIISWGNAMFSAVSMTIPKKLRMPIAKIDLISLWFWFIEFSFSYCNNMDHFLVS